MRKSLKEMQDPEEYEFKRNQLEHLEALASAGYIDLYFGDESGFNREGYTSYCWQERGKYLSIIPSKTKTAQVFGLLSSTNRLEAYSSRSTINSNSMIAFLDDFCGRINKRTVVVLDNAPVHRSKIFEQKMEQCSEQDLEIFFLPRYSPHLNPIEILWRKMKYEWLDYTEITTQEELDKQVENIIANYSKDFVIEFT